MKKLLIALLTVLMVLTSGATVFAEEDTKDCNVTLTYADTEEYEWTIDYDTITLTADTLEAYVTVTVTSAALNAGHTLEISCNDSVNLENGTDTIAATVDFEGISLAAKDSLDDCVATITVDEAYDPTVYVVPVGDYTGTLTFTASIAE